MSLLPYAVGFGVIAGVSILAHKLFTKNNKLYCYAILFEKVGEVEVFKDVVKIFKTETNAVTCLKIQGEQHSYIDMPESDDFLPSKKYEKILLITKYGDRDFRVKKRFNDTWYRKHNKQVFKESYEIDKVTGEEVLIKTEVLNKEGNPIFEVIEEKYIEPIGITQEGMDAVRTSLQNEREINKELESTGFWNKYGTSMVFIAGLMIVALMVIKTTQNTVEASNNLVDVCSEMNIEVKEISNEVKNPMWAEKVLNYVQTKNNVVEPPPT